MKLFFYRTKKINVERRINRKKKKKINMTLLTWSCTRKWFFRFVQSTNRQQQQQQLVIEIDIIMMMIRITCVKHTRTKKKNTPEQQLRVKLTPIISSTTFILSLLIVIVVSFFSFFSGFVIYTKTNTNTQKKDNPITELLSETDFFFFLFLGHCRNTIVNKICSCLCPLLFNQDNDDHHHRRPKIQWDKYVDDEKNKNRNNTRINQMKKKS